MKQKRVSDDRASELDLALEDARTTIYAFMGRHKAATVPCLIGALVEWAVMHGAGETIRSSLLNGVHLTDELVAERGKRLD